MNEAEFALKLGLKNLKQKEKDRKKNLIVWGLKVGHRAQVVQAELLVILARPQEDTK